MEGVTIESIVSSLVLNIINIIVLFTIIKILIYKPVRMFMNKRTQTIQSSLISAEEVRDEIENLKVHYMSLEKSSSDRAETILREGTLKADKAAQDIVDSAKRQSEKILTDAKAQIKQEHDQSIANMKNDITNLAIDIAKNVLEREVSVKDNNDIIDRFFNKVV